MRPSTRLGLVIFVPLLALFGLYTAYWLFMADRLQREVAAWAETPPARQLGASWQKLAVSGFPTSFRLRWEAAVLRNTAANPAAELHMPRLVASAAPWDFRDWRLAAPDGLIADLPANGARLAARRADGAFAIAPDGGMTVWLTLENTLADAGERVQIGVADSWLILPAKAPESDADRTLSLAFHAQQVQLPAGLTPFGNTIDDVALGLVLKGAIPAGPLRQAATKWREAGGTVELDNFRLYWGSIGATGTGTLALDRDLQPIAAFSGAVQGYDQIMTSLEQNGMIRARDAGLARLALQFLARPGNDGRSEIRTSFAIQNGQMYLGPAKLGPMPRINWD
jgi:hypothetical protein